MANNVTGRLIMDAFASAGYLTLGPDYFRGVSSFYTHYTILLLHTSQKY